MKLVPKKVRLRLEKHLIKNFPNSGHDLVLTLALFLLSNSREMNTKGDI